MDLTHPAPAASTRAEALAGIRDLSPAMIAAVPIGLLFGAVAATKGLSVLEVMLMGATVFAGGAQFAAIEIWGTPVPVAALLVSTLLINLRHVLMGASLAEKTGHWRPWQRLLGFGVMADENWAFAERRAKGGPVSFAYFGGAGGVFWLNWIVWTGVGAALGPLMGDPKRLGADFAFTALFIGLVAGFGRSRPVIAAVMASGAVAALVSVWIGPPWHVVAGSLAGIAVAALAAPREAAR